MTESIYQHLKFHMLVGCYGSFVLELPDMSSADREMTHSITLGSDGAEHGYPTFSDNKSPAAALRAFADKLEGLFGLDPKNQTEALTAWQAGEVTDMQELIRRFGDKAKR